MFKFVFLNFKYLLTKHSIVNEIANDKEYKSICKKLSPILHEDLYQDLMIILLKYDENKLIEIHNKNQLKFFIVKILMNQSKSQTSPLFKQHLLKPNYKDIDWYDEHDNLNELLIQTTESTIDLYSAKNDDNWYRTELFRLYLRIGSIRALSRQTTIPVMSIQRSLSEFKRDIKQLVNENTFSTSI